MGRVPLKVGLLFRTSKLLFKVNKGMSSSFSRLEKVFEQHSVNTSWKSQNRNNLNGKLHFLTVSHIKGQHYMSCFAPWRIEADVKVSWGHSGSTYSPPKQKVHTVALHSARTHAPFQRSSCGLVPGQLCRRKHFVHVFYLNINIHGWNAAHKVNDISGNQWEIKYGERTFSLSTSIIR